MHKDYLISYRMFNGITVNWDFTNYTFSFLVSLVSAILGIAHPLFLESIRKIDEQYESTVLSSLFQHARIFRLHRIALFVAIAISFVAPFAMLICDCKMLNITVVTIQCFCVIILVTIMLRMFQTIQIFYNPSELAKYLFDENHYQDHECIPDLLLGAIDLMRYTSKRPNPNVYLQCKDYFVSAASAELSSKGNQFYNLPSHIQNALLIATDYAMDKRVKPLCYDNRVAQIFYNIYAKYYNGEQNYQTIWMSLSKMMESDNSEWFQQYWSAALQYYAFVMKNAHNEAGSTESSLSPQERFLELHHVLGALLVYNGRYDWLSFILTHDHVSPPKFYLIPSSFDEIINVIYKLEQQKTSVWKLTSKYRFKDISEDIDSDYRIVSLMYQYAALLAIRLFCYNNYNIRYKDPMALPTIDNLIITELDKTKSVVERLRVEVVNHWYANKLIDNVKLPYIPEVSQVTDFIDGFIDAIHDKMNVRIKNPKVDTQKFHELKSLLAYLDSKQRPITMLPSDEERNTWTRHEKIILIERQLSLEQSTTDGYRGWSNLPDTLLHYLQTEIENYLDIRYSMLAPTADLLVCERNIFTALNKLGIPAGYTILTMGVYLGGIDMKYNQTPILRYVGKDATCLYGNIPVIERNSSMSAIFIAKSDDLLKIAFSEDEGTHFNDCQMKL